MTRLPAVVLLAVLVGLAAVGLGAVVGGNLAPDGTEVQCDLPVELHRRNTTSRGQGCCVWTSIHHAALWQNVPAYQEAPKWIQEHSIPGGAYPGAVEKYLPEMARQRGASQAPAFLNYEGSDLELLKLACRTGRMPAVTYSFSPSGRYGGGRIAHMVNLDRLKAAKYASLAARSRPTGRAANIRIQANSWGGGRWTSHLPLFKMTMVGRLLWGSRGHGKSKNLVNNHAARSL